MENAAFKQWEFWAGLEEKYLKQKSKLHWLQVGDRNNKVFHRAAQERVAMNSIKEIQCLDDQHALTRVVSGDEIKQVLFSMPNDKSPGPDGYTSEFYKSAWGILGTEFVLVVQSFFAKMLLPKVISKIIANRLKRVLPKFVSSNQSAFVQDRLLIENVLLATEIVKDYHKNSLTGRCAIKIDISKAFDSVQWSFLSKSLTAMKFPRVLGDYVKGVLCPRICLFYAWMFYLNYWIGEAGEHVFGYHPQCRNLNLTHLSFADDFMVLSDGKLRSIEGIIRLAEEVVSQMNVQVPFEVGTLLIQKRIGSWTARYLSYAGRFNLISTVLWSVCNIWMAAYRLPSTCIDEINFCFFVVWDGDEHSASKGSLGGCLQTKNRGRSRVEVSQRGKLGMLSEFYMEVGISQ
ncbi:PREDICTED: uncharacterized protein LOC109129900 [Camelina sativa]|uniref:Uncharacterized protein LOC109129900 n=1 Tax=Camelina sativa TaxID=90675 RepID=A0ABM1R638_CAMSA|nr:PREDICTED: uncharacterized protein LOC109129900 [Camelina sativa]